MNITLLPESSRISIEEMIQRFGQEQKVIACDFYLYEIESRGQEMTYGLVCGNITNIDHHAPIAAMEKMVSSATLAVDYVTEFGAQRDAAVVVNHTDCDSALSSLIVSGALAPERRFSDAAIAADHTGEINNIADLLQALQDERDLDMSLRNLRLMLAGGTIEAEAQTLLNKRLDDREQARRLVDSGAFQLSGHLAYAETVTKFDGAFLPALLPDSWVIILGSPLRDTGMNEVKVRLGKNAPKGITLHSLGLKDTEIRFAGRWNAGSNKRSGGTLLSVEECAAIVLQKLEQAIAASV